MRWLLIVPAVLLLIGAAMYVVGLFRPRGHTARTQARFASDREAVWAVVAGYERWAEWQPELKRVERLPDVDGPTTLITEGSWGEMPMRIEELDAPRRLRTFLDGGVFSGRWTWDLEAAAGGGTVVTLTEEGEIGNPFFRTMMMFHDNYRTMVDVLRALGGRLGESVEPERLR